MCSTLYNGQKKDNINIPHFSLVYTDSPIDRLITTPQQVVNETKRKRERERELIRANRSEDNCMYHVLVDSKRINRSGHCMYQQQYFLRNAICISFWVGILFQMGKIYINSRPNGT